MFFSLTMHKTRLHIGQLVKDTSAKLKQASETDHSAGISASKKVADAKLAKDFQAVLKEFQNAQRLAAERETSYAPSVPKAVLPSRFLSKLKSYCRNKRYPEGSIAERYLAEECMTFCSRYLEDVETRLNRPSRNAGLNDPNFAKTYLFQSYREPIGKVEIAKLDERSWNTPNSEEANSEQQTVIGSSNVPETLDEPAEFQTESGGTCRGRGRTLLKDLYNLNPVERVKVSRNSHGQPVGSKARLLAGYLGIIARNAYMLPINYESWHHIPDSNKNQALDNIKERFTLEVSDDYIKKALGKKWRDHKSTLKKQYFKKDISLKEKLRNVLPGMLRYQWEYADRERVGTNTRQKQKFTHTVGSRSFASVAEAEMQASTVEQIVEVERKYEELQQQLRADATAKEAATAAREAEAAAMAAEQSRKYDELQLQLQHMMQMFQQSQKPPS
ncbi:hypothetical protein PVK06_034055 [Gossypium arboreum]|uniref:DUF4218 domain-containing protein n=1 Tax=Gossypium arboreum TaxID=29729 RepID=A0ABR0ND65_GOSAR|nr:hypothetical protein PVK06_034055 [Gossypium arboreum]